MCGIIACLREKGETKEDVLSGLKALEYRGYDSWGIATRDRGSIERVRAVGKISDAGTRSVSPLRGSAAIGHTRWATHGGVTEANAHPHWNKDRTIAVVHNGIIENADALRREIAEAKKTSESELFESQTDTEVLPYLIEHELGKGLAFEEAFREAVKRIRGRFTFVVLSTLHPGIFGTRDGSPLVVGIRDGAMMLSSDTQALAKWTTTINVLADREYAVLYPDRYVIKTLDRGDRVDERRETIPDADAVATKGAYPHYMLKEIMEERDTVDRAIHQEDDIVLHAARLLKGKRVFLTGCGTAARMASLGQYLFSELGETDAQTFVGSEFHPHASAMDAKSVVVAISQSGETADVLEALRIAKKRGARIIAILNARGTSMERMADLSIFIGAGPERAVASTKAATGQIALLALLASALGGKLKEGKHALRKAGDAVKAWSLEDLSAEMKRVAAFFASEEHCYIIGRGKHAPIAEEAAIKIQEVAYIHAHGFAGGELKHGPLALVTEGTRCIAFLPSDATKGDMEGNISELKARGAWVLGISPTPHKLFDEWIAVPDLGPAQPIASIVPIQLLAYHLAVLRGNDPDMPRNLAKSVTVK